MAKKRFISLVREQIAGVLVGAFFSASVSLVVWSFAYVGWIDLALPAHFDHEKLDHLIRRNLPSDYDYSAYGTSIRTGAEATYVIVGHSKDMGSPDKDKEADIILFVDKAAGDYKVSYSFQPEDWAFSSEHGEEPRVYAHHVNELKRADLNQDGRDEIITGWSVLGAHWNPPAIIIFGSDGASIYATGIKDYAPVEANTFVYEKVPVKNVKDDSQEFSTVTAESFDIKDARLGLINRTDKECYGCSNKAIYSVQFFSMWEKSITPSYDNKENIHGYSQLKKFMTGAD